jgi:glycosidase
VPGIPVIYYGDEYGMPGANDPDNRRMMQFDGLDTNEQKLKSTLQELIALRNSNMALLYGSTEITVVNDDVLVIHRQYFDEHVWFFLNKGAEEAMIPMELVQQTGVESTIETGVGGLYSVMTIDKLYFGVNPNSFGILKSEKKE